MAPLPSFLLLSSGLVQGHINSGLSHICNKLSPPPYLGVVCPSFLFLFPPSSSAETRDTDSVGDIWSWQVAGAVCSWFEQLWKQNGSKETQPPNYSALFGKSWGSLTICCVIFSILSPPLNEPIQSFAFLLFHFPSSFLHSFPILENRLVAFHPVHELMPDPRTVSRAHYEDL